MGATGKEQQSDNPDPGVVVGYNKHRLVKARLLLLVGGGLLLLVVLAVGTIAMLSATNKDNSNQKQQPFPVANEQFSQADLVSRVNMYLAQKSYNAAIYILQVQHDQGYNTKSLLGLTYVTAGRYQEALNVYNALAKSGGVDKLSRTDNALAGQAAAQVGQYQQAIDYYQRALNQTQAVKTGNLQQVADEAAGYQQAIQDAEQKL